MANSVLNYIINVMKKGNGDKQTVTALQSVKSVMTGIGVAAGVATAAYVAYDKVIGESVRTTVKYADEVRKLMSVTKQNAQETSKLIQVADDYKISSDQLLVATKKLATQGFAMNIETLATLSDKYKSLTSAQEKQQFLTKNFGKTGQDYITLLEAGGDALRNQATQVNENLILTEKQIKAARELEIAQDDLADAQQGYAIAIGNKVIPAQIAFYESVADLAEITDLASLRLVNNLNAIEYAPIDSATRSYMAMEEAIGSNGVAGAVEDTGDAIRGLSDAEESFLLSTREMTPQAVAEFVTLQTKILEVKRMIAAGASFNVIVNFLAGKTVMVVPGQMAPGQNPGAPAPKTTVSISQTGANVNTKVGTPGHTAIGGYPAAWTVVGEHGKEIIDPSGYIHSNAESRRMIDAGITPFRSLATGGNVGFSEPGAVFNPTVTKTGLAGLDAKKKALLSSGFFTSAANAARSSSGGGSAPVAQTAAVTQQAAEVNIAAAQSVAASSQSIQESNVKAVSATQIQTAVNTQQNNAMLSELRGLRNDIKSIIPKAIGDAYQKVIGA